MGFCQDLLKECLERNVQKLWNFEALGIADKNEVHEGFLNEIFFTGSRYSVILNKGEWKQFVRHRVNEILKLTSKVDWGHCPGIENPADIGSRGESASQLKDNELWRVGPEWLATSYPGSFLRAQTLGTPAEKRPWVLFGHISINKILFLLGVG